MASPQENYTYEELLKYLGIAQVALANFIEMYPDMDIYIRQPENDVINDLNIFKENYAERLFEMNAFLDDDEKEGIEIGSYVPRDSSATKQRLMRRIEMEKKCFLSDLSHLVRLHETQMRVLYMELSRMSAKFTADRIQELHRRETWVETQRHYLGLYHIKQCKRWSAAKDIDLTFCTSFTDIPEESGVYFLFDKGEIVYIGHSSNIHKRIKNHDIVRTYYSNKSGFDIECVYASLPIEQARSTERKLIELVKPRHNERGKI